MEFRKKLENIVKSTYITNLKGLLKTVFPFAEIYDSLRSIGYYVTYVPKEELAPVKSNFENEEFRMLLRYMKL